MDKGLGDGFMASTPNSKAGMVCGVRGHESIVGTVVVLWGL